MTRKTYDQLRKEFFRRGGKLLGRVNRRIKNRGGQILERDALVTITGKGGGLQIEVKACKHCKQASSFRQVDYTSIDLMEAIPTQPADPRRVKRRPRREPPLIDAVEGDF